MVSLSLPKLALAKNTEFACFSFMLRQCLLGPFHIHDVELLAFLLWISFALHVQLSIL